MVDYKLVKQCRICKARFVVPKSESKQIYCDACQSKTSDESSDGSRKDSSTDS